MMNRFDLFPVDEYDGYWLCLCCRVHVPETEVCPECCMKRREGLEVLSAVKRGLKRDLGLLEANHG